MNELKCDACKHLYSKEMEMNVSLYCKKNNLFFNNGTQMKVVSEANNCFERKGSGIPENFVCRD